MKNETVDMDIQIQIHLIRKITAAATPVDTIE